MAPPLTIREVFTDCQGGMHSHSRLVKCLTKVYQKTPLDEFWATFLHHLKYSMIVFKREPAVERTIEFVAKFATSLCLDNKPEKTEDKNEEEEQEEEDEEMHPFLLKIFSFLLKHHNANDKAVRFRCCQLVNKLLVFLGDDAQIDDDLYDKIYECMLQRLRDKFPVVRMQSVLALTRLQDPQNKECPVISAYLFLLVCDPNPDVRRAVLSCIAATTKTLPAILERTRDTRDLVRKLAYQVIAEKIHVRALTIAQRVSMLKEGLNDRSAAVKEACTTRLLQAWLRNYQGNILELLKCLDVENALDASNQLLAALFQKSPSSELLENFDLLNQELTLPIEALECESALYWRSLCSFIKSAGGTDADEYLDKILPTGSVLAKYIEMVSEHMKAENNLEAQLRNEFILQQILELAALLDFSDEVGRRQIDKVMKALLLSEHISHSLVKPIMAVFKLVHIDPDTRVAALVETISDIREPISIVENTKILEHQRQRDLKMASIRVELNQLREDLDGCVQKQEFERAAEIKTKVSELETNKQNLMDESSQSASQEVRVEKNDPVTLLKCMTIACEMLQETALHGLSPMLQTLMEVLILPGITDQEPAVRNAALKALGLCCLLKQDTAKAHLLLFMQVAQIDQEGVKVTSLKIIFDLLHTFGLEAFEVNSIDENTSQSGDAQGETPFGEDEDEDDILNLSQSRLPEAAEEKTNTASSVLNILVTLLESESSEVRTVAAEGLAKLMISGRLISAKVMSRLLILWYNPVTQDDSHLRHCLGAFFPIFAFAGRSNQQILEEAFLPTLRTLFNAPATSPLAEINTANVAELLAQLTSTRHLVNKQITEELGEEGTPHDNLAVKLCNEILSDPNSFNVRSLCKVLNSLELSAGNVTILKDIKVLAQRMLKEVRDKQCSKMLEKFHRVSSDTLKLFMSSQPHAGDGDLSSVEEEIDATQAQLSRMEVDDKVNETATQETGEEEPEILPDGDGDTTGIIRLRSKRNGKSTQTPSTITKRAKKTEDEEESSDSDAEAPDVFSSPSPVKRCTRNITTKDSVAESPAHVASPAQSKRSARNNVNSPAVVASPVRRSARNVNSPAAKASPTPTRRTTRGRKDNSKPTLRNTRKKLQDYLSDSDSQPSDNEAPVATKGRTRGQHNRTPLSDIENERH